MIVIQDSMCYEALGFDSYTDHGVKEAWPRLHKKGMKTKANEMEEEMQLVACGVCFSISKHPI
jgi:hypothetical protein